MNAYGYRLGRPGGWLLPGLQPAGELRTVGYDKTSPAHQFERASMQVKVRLSLATPELPGLPGLPGLPWTFATDAEV